MISLEFDDIKSRYHQLIVLKNYIGRTLIFDLRNLTDDISDDYFQFVLESTTDDPYLRLFALNQLAIIYNDVGKYHKAEKTLLRAKFEFESYKRLANKHYISKRYFAETMRKMPVLLGQSIVRQRPSSKLAIKLFKDFMDKDEGDGSFFGYLALRNYYEIVMTSLGYIIYSYPEQAYNINNEIYGIKGKVVINATGVFSDKIMKMDSPGKKKMIKPSQGVHLVLDQKFLKSQHAILIPHTSDGRVLFAVPWNKHVILGTTDTPLNEIRDEPIALKEEIKFILKNAQNFMTEKPTKNDIKSVFAGLRPLAAESDKENTKEIWSESSI